MQLPFSFATNNSCQKIQEFKLVFQNKGKQRMRNYSSLFNTAVTDQKSNVFVLLDTSTFLHFQQK